MKKPNQNPHVCGYGWGCCWLYNGCSSDTLLSHAAGCPVGSSDGLSTGAIPADAIDRGAKGTPWYAVQVGSVVCTIEPLAGFKPATCKLQIYCSIN